MLHGYCVRRAIDPPMPEGLRGVDGLPVRVLEDGRLQVWVSDDRGISPTVDRLRQHERVVRSALKTATPLPLRFGSGFPSEREALATLSRRAEEFDRSLRRFEGRVEMGLRISRAGSAGPANDQPGGARKAAVSTVGAETWEEGTTGTARTSGPDGHLGAGGTERVLPPPASSIDGVTTGEEPRHGAPSGEGRLYLEGRRAALRADRAARDEAEDVVAWITAFLADPDLPAEHTVLPGGGLLATVAHLVRRAKIRQYKDRIGELGRSRPDLRIEVSGPWAPYSFV